MHFILAFFLNGDQHKAVYGVNYLDTYSHSQRGDAMDKTKQPSKEMIREWLKNQIGQHRPPPDPGQIRRELDWKLNDIPPIGISQNQ